ncbi:ficolin-1-A-like [Drosophila albomicans]|uniref:Ficolin-1-A-like n=1 Tax=Drosophila albomicans TaxID=7291 RepID=A0A9C6SQT3_DROAB|nr:ficolin-1-A-like [Drosophila albomicans]
MTLIRTKVNLKALKKKAQSTLQTEVKHCNSWKELFKNKLSSKDDELNDCFTKNQQISGSSIPSTSLPTSCLNLTSGIQEIQLPNGNPYYVLCDSDGWMIIQRRIDGSQDFNKTWQEYVDGIGDIHGEFFMGLENLHLITNATRQQLNISIKTDYSRTRVAEYDDFRIGNSESLYELESIGNFTGDEYIINALQHHIKRPFSTYDRKSPDLETEMGGWWYSDVDDYCYLNAPHTDAGYSEVYWRYVVVNAVTMAIRPYLTEH